VYIGAKIVYGDVKPGEVYMYPGTKASPALGLYMHWEEDREGAGSVIDQKVIFELFIVFP
jgi:hypothetical protein